MIPAVGWGWMRIGRPLSSKGGVISNTCSTHATNMKSVASAKYRPGHILLTAQHSLLAGSSEEQTYRLPDPKITPLGSAASGFSLPSLK